jgi:hypothetical protein
MAGSACRAWLWAAVASGDEYETGPPDAISVGTRGVVRLGVRPGDAVVGEGQRVLSRSGAVPDAGSEAIPSVTDVGGEGPQ